MTEAQPGPIRVLLVDDHPAFREGVRCWLEAEGMEVVGEALTGAEVVPLCRELDPDVVVLDIRMPEADGLAAMHAMKQHALHPKVIVLTGNWHSQFLVRSIIFGASAFFLKSVPREELVAAVRAVAAGENLLRISEIPTVLERWRSEDTALAPVAVRKMVKLSVREREVLRLIVQGMSNRQIAEHLGIGPATAKTHVENVMRKLGVSDRTQAAVWAVYSGVIEP